MFMVLDDVVVQNLRRIMEQKGLKQKSVATKAGIPLATFYALTSGRKAVTTKYVLNITRALDITPNELYTM